MDGQANYIVKWKNWIELSACMSNNFWRYDAMAAFKLTFDQAENQINEF